MKYDILAREFPKFDQSTLPSIPDTWLENSWRNDTCPSFISGDPEGKHYHIFIDYQDTKDRELGDCCPRFSVCVEDGDGSVATYFESDDWSEILACVAAN